MPLVMPHRMPDDYRKETLMQNIEDVEDIMGIRKRRKANAE